MLHFNNMNAKTPLSEDIIASRRFKKRWLLVLMMLIIIGFILFAWSQRISIADKALRDQLKDYDVAIDYEIVEIGPRFQRLRNIVIGDPEKPDFTAKEIDIDVKINLAGAVLRTIWVRGGYLKGSYKEGELSFGALDTLLESDDETPFELPDLALDIANSKMQLDSDWGIIGIGLSGRGHLQRSFNGALAVKSNKLNFNDCSIDNSRYAGRIKISNQQPSLDGWITNDSIICDIGSIKGTSIAAELSLSRAFDRWRGNADIIMDRANSDGIALRALEANVGFSGNAERTDLQYDLQKTAIKASDLSIADAQTKGEARLSFSETGYNIAALGNASVAGASANPSVIANLRSYRNIADNSPIAPLLRIWAPALANSSANFSATMGYDIALGDTVNNQNNIVLDNVKLASKSGARISLSNIITFTKNSNASQWRIESPIGFALRGGNLPSLTANVQQSSGNIWSGKIEMPAYTAGNALLALKAFQFKGSPSGNWSFSGSTVMSGAIPAGRVERLSLPIDGEWNPNGGFTLLKGCRNISFASLQASDLRLQNQNIEICPEGQNSIVRSRGSGIEIAGQTQNFSAVATLGQSPISMQSANIIFSLKEGLSASDVAVSIGESDNLSSFEMRQLTADFNGPFISGKAIDGSAKIGAVPLDMDNAQLDWRFEDSILSASGSLTVSDAEQEDRFEPVFIPDLLLSLENGEITALASIQEPNIKRKLADVDLKHNLSDTSGRALFSVDNLVFNDELQPEQLTNIVLGVIANVQGAISGDGQFIWDENDVKSTGKFSTQDMDLAAAFGPVRGLSGEIALTDLINFESEDRQILTLASVNPGVEVLDGRISYQLLPGQKIQIYGGSWPFAGGRLVLEPTIWDLAEDVERKMAFEVTGMDAGVFLSQFEFASLSATGFFNGRLPMVFNAEGGRIVGGSLVSVSGGNFSYTDALTAEDLSAFGNYAFDSLKSIDYETLTVDMDGNIDGEIVTGVRITGLKQGAGANRNFVTKQLAKIPLEFNVKIEASFLDLIYLIEGVGDPDATLRRYAPNFLTSEYRVIKNEQPVQPSESKDSP